MTGYVGSRDYIGTLQSLWRTLHIDPHIQLKNRTPTLSLQTPTLSLRVFCAQNSKLEGRSLYFSWMCGSVWGPPRRLRVPYVIPRPGVPRHMQNPIFSENFILLMAVLLTNTLLGMWQLLSFLRNRPEYIELFVKFNFYPEIYFILEI